MLNKPTKRDRTKIGATTTDTPGIRLDTGKRKPADAPADAPADKPADAPADAPADKPADAPADAPADKPADKPAGKRTAKTKKPAPARKQKTTKK